MKLVLFFKYSFYKYYLILLFFILNHLFSLTKKETINFEFKNKNLKSALIQIIDDYSLSIIFPEDVNNTIINSKCFNCSKQSALDSILNNTKYKWIKIESQFTIYEPNLKNEYRISGQIIDKQTGEPIQFANVYIPELKIGDVTNYSGHFSIFPINNSKCLLIISYIGYKTQKIPLSFPNNDTSFKKILLSPKIILTDKISIFGSNYEFMGKSKNPGQIAFSPRFISSLPNFGEIDIFRSLQLLPGIQLGLGGTSDLFIKGSTPEQNLVLLDGMPIYQTNHMYGFISGINSNAIKDVQIFSGSVPAKYGGRINSVIELTSKKGNSLKPHGEVQKNFISSSFSIETPILSRGSFIIHQRNSNKTHYKSNLQNEIYSYTTGDDQFNLIQESINTINNQKATYIPESSFSDIITRLSLLLTPSHNVSLTNIYGIDSTKEDRLFWGFESILGYESTQIKKQTKKENQGVSLNFSSNWNNQLNSRLIISRYNLSNFYNSKQFSIEPNNNLINRGTAIDKNNFEDNSINLSINYKGFDNNKTTLGIEHSTYNIYISEKKRDGLNTNQSIYKNNTILNSFYIQNQFLMKNKINIQTGLRFEYLYNTKKSYKSPRISFIYNFTSNFSYEASIGQHYQFIHHLLKTNSNTEKDFYWITSSNKIPTISSFNFYNGFNITKQKYIFKTSLYNRSLDNLFQFNNSQLKEFSEKNIADSLIINKGTGSSKGFELLIRKKKGNITGWISYHLNRTKYNYPLLNNGSNFLSDHDKTHEIKTVFITKLKYFNLTANWVLSSGRVYTNLDNMFIDSGYEIKTLITEEKNDNRLPIIHHLDISISKQWILNKIIIQTGVSIYNLYDKKNISHIRYNPYSNPDQITPKNISMFGITPSGFIKIRF